MAELVTTGNGEVERIADRADLRLSYSGRGRDRTAAVNELTKRIGTVEPLLERDGVQVRSRRLSVHDVWDGRRRSGAAAEQSYQLRITDVTVLDDLVAALVTTEPTGIDGPFWDLADQTEPAREAQRSAVADARGRAEGLAEALGARLGALVQVTDGSPPNSRMMPFGMAASASVRLRGGPVVPEIASLSLEPQPVAVHANCTITWELLA
jgi:hypothetical protein